VQWSALAAAPGRCVTPGSARVSGRVHAVGMSRQPERDTLPWDAVLAHRPAEAWHAVAARFADNGVGPQQWQAAVDDGGDVLHAAAGNGRPDWAEQFGGPLALALLAAVVSSLAAHLKLAGVRSARPRRRRAAGLLQRRHRGRRLGVARQKVYDIGRSRRAGPFLDQVPWRQP
jgi:hypothetical protein